MKTVAIKDAKNRFSELGRAAEAGETIVITRNGKPAFDLVPHQAGKGGVDFEAFEKWKQDKGYGQVVTYVAPDFDEPLPEDFLLRPLP